jgi:hypothetical protein
MSCHLFEATVICIFDKHSQFEEKMRYKSQNVEDHYYMTKYIFSTNTFAASMYCTVLLFYVYYRPIILQYIAK